MFIIYTVLEKKLFYNQYFRTGRYLSPSYINNKNILGILKLDFFGLLPLFDF